MTTKKTKEKPGLDLESLKRKHGEVAVARLKGKPVIVCRRAGYDEWKQLEDADEKDEAHAKALSIRKDLILACLLYPDSADAESTLKKRPGLVGQLTRSIRQLSNLKVTEEEDGDEPAIVARSGEKEVARCRLAEFKELERFTAMNESDQLKAALNLTADCRVSPEDRDAFMDAVRGYPAGITRLAGTIMLASGGDVDIEGNS